jgi:hypothetical protein
MRRFLMILVLALVVTPFALAATADEAPTAPTVEVAVEATADVTVDVEPDASLEEIFAEIEGTHNADKRYICPDPGDCTYLRDCQLQCGPGAMMAHCENPSGYACAGTCTCD